MGALQRILAIDRVGEMLKRCICPANIVGCSQGVMMHINEIKWASVGLITEVIF